MAAVRRVVAIASGKGGVGKTTVAVNLALGLVQRGYRVGLLDADVHGPNVPLMLGVRRRTDVGGWQAIVPVGFASEQIAAQRLPALERHGLKIMSIGLLVGENQATLVDNASVVGLLIRQLLTLVDWGELDILLIDFPPGTGEPQATVLTTVHLDGVVLVITPQDVARLDTSRALAAFRQVGVPIVGVVENMSYLLCPSCGDRIDVFHRGHAERPIGDEAIPVLAAFPIEPTISAAADLGRPVVIGMPESAQAAIFLDLAATVAARLDLDHADDRDI